jgi:Fe-S-cluster containining protein
MSVGKGGRQKNYFDICGRCRIACCQDARPPITLRREKIIEEYLKNCGINIKDPFVHGQYAFPKEDRDGYCIFYDKETRKCIVHPVKPETCVAGPVTFDINPETGKIEWYLKTENICPLAGVIFKDKEMLKKHFEIAREEILRLVRELSSEALKTILSREEPETFKIGEEEVESGVLNKLKSKA